MKFKYVVTFSIAVKSQIQWLSFTNNSLEIEVNSAKKTKKWWIMRKWKSDVLCLIPFSLRRVLSFFLGSSPSDDSIESVSSELSCFLFCCSRLSFLCGGQVLVSVRKTVDYLTRSYEILHAEDSFKKGLMYIVHCTLYICINVLYFIIFLLVSRRTNRF